MEPANLNYCIDCRYCRQASPHMPIMPALCTHPESRDLVGYFRTAAHMRLHERFCGEPGRWFEARPIPPRPKPGFWKRFWKL